MGDTSSLGTAAVRVDWSDIDGVRLQPVRRHEDDRGSFEKLFESSEKPLVASQLCVSFNHLRGTIRGLHLQVEPHPEHKSLWCSSGNLFDVIVDARADSPTRGDWAGVQL